MDDRDPRAALAALIDERREDFSALSRLIGRNPAYVQQYLRRGTPRRLAETDRAVLARYFGVPESLLGGPEANERASALRPVPRFDIGASAGAGAAAMDIDASMAFAFPDAALKRLRGRSDTTGLSTIRVTGESMMPTLLDGDDILVDHDDARHRLRDGIYVIRAGDTLLVKRLVRRGDGFEVRSDNPHAAPVDLGEPDQLGIIGRVLWTGRAL